MIQPTIKSARSEVTFTVLADLLTETVDLEVSADRSMDPGSFAELSAAEARELAQQLINAADYLEE